MEPAKGSVLLVDPDVSASTPLVQLVERQGYLVHTADSAEGALGAALQIAPDVVMAPISLDDLEPGIFHRLREQLPQASIVALGERDGPQDGQRDVERALRRGADRYLAQPVRERAVAVVLQRAMEKPTLARKLAAAEARPVARSCSSTV
jgi:CheY-like chemotaxis protein